MTVKVSGWIEEIPKELGQASPGPAKLETAEGDDYEDGKANLFAKVPEGWRLMNIGTDH